MSDNRYHTFHIQINGIVQGVGFRPFVYQLAHNLGLRGWVNNTVNGVHIRFNATEDLSIRFLDRIRSEKPSVAHITGITLNKIAFENFDDFRILLSDEAGEKKLLVTPDYAVCEACLREVNDPASRRFRYAFNSCTNCGPRYSIIQSLPYDRDRTTMDGFELCDQCRMEYNDPADRRFYHQTNSCPTCPVSMTVYQNTGKKMEIHQGDIIRVITEGWNAGKIIGIKGIGGYLITCDAANQSAIDRLRELKNRPSKPFALMYHDLYALAEDVELDAIAASELQSIHAPIVLLSLKDDRMTPLATGAIAPGLDQIGVMLPYTPLYKMLMDAYQRPVVATSGNKSGSTIIFEDDEALEHLAGLCDLIIANDRRIVVPQDDSVIKISTVKRQKIVIRKSRGLAPSYLSSIQPTFPEQTILCMGAALKSTFTLLHKGNVFVSQYLGDTGNWPAQQNYIQVMKHLLALFDIKPDHIVVDAHPDYFTTRYGSELAEKWGLRTIKIQHHEAHFWSVLAENGLLNSKVTGVIWDGTGFGQDGNIWGGEIFSYDGNHMKRAGHLDYFDFILGDKMPREPRISSLALLGENAFIENKFTPEEWRIYIRLLEDNTLMTSSAGRLFDAVASILLGIDHQTYEGEAAMKLEQAAYRYFKKYGATTFYTYLQGDEIPGNFPRFVGLRLIEDLKKGYETDFLAAKFHITIAHYIANWVKQLALSKVAFSGGVFQNGWIVDLIKMFLESKFDLYFHRDFSPNDEGISYGQLIAYLFGNQRTTQ